MYLILVAEGEDGRSVDRFSLPPLVTASTWASVWSSLWSQALARRGATHDSDGTVAPAMTNREALAIVMALRRMARATGAEFPLWYQFAAPAYAWTPGTDVLDATDRQADEEYPADAAVQLHLELQRLTAELDDRAVKEPRLEISDVFADGETQREVAAALRDDGARAEFKIPLPACKDPNTGKPARPVYDDRDRKWKCPGGVVTIDDPITAIIKSAAPLAIIAILAYGAGVIWSKKPRRRRRKG